MLIAFRSQHKAVVTQMSIYESPNRSRMVDGSFQLTVSLEKLKNESVSVLCVCEVIDFGASSIRNKIVQQE